MPGDVSVVVSRLDDESGLETVGRGELVESRHCL